MKPQKANGAGANKKPPSKRQLGLEILSPRSARHENSLKSSIAFNDDIRTKTNLKGGLNEPSFSSTPKNNNITPKAAIKL